jgi:hypothetical protein
VVLSGSLLNQPKQERQAEADRDGHEDSREDLQRHATKVGGFSVVA